MNYSELTIEDRNRVKRWAQATRYRHAVALAAAIPFDAPPRILDFGAGDAELFRQRRNLRFATWHAYEPTAEMLRQARHRLGKNSPVVLEQSVSNLPSASFDVIFCLEVFEHLSSEDTEVAGTQIRQLLAPGGRAVVGVPVEVGPPALVKGLFRMTRRHGDFDANWRNVLSATLGLPPTERPRIMLSPGVTYHPHHMGFDFRSFRRWLSASFRVERLAFSPLPLLGAAFNLEAYFVLASK